MKILHTSDWHLGQEFYSFDRSEEHIAFLTQLRDIVREEQPDTLLISGDIYHNATPSNVVMRMFTDYLDQVRNACPTMTIVVIAGNHDSSSRLEVSSTLWQHLGVCILGKIERKEGEVDLDRHIIAIPNRDGEICGYVVALPFTSPQAFHCLHEDTPREELQSVFLQALADRIDFVNDKRLPVIMMAHMAITGSDVTGHDLTQGGMDYVPVSALKVDFDYLALGHIHCPQTLHASNPMLHMEESAQECTNDSEVTNHVVETKDSDESACARYCGSPIPVNFEERYVHSVTVVEIASKGDKPKLRTIPIHNPWPLKTFPKEAKSFDEVLKDVEKLPDDEKAYLRLHVKLDDVPPQNAMERAAEAVSKKLCRFCCFKWERPEKRIKEVRSFADVDQMKSHSPLDIAELYYENKYGQPLGDDLKAMLSEVISEVNHQTND